MLLKNSLLVSLIAATVLFLILSPVLIRLNSYLHPIVLGVVFFCMVFAVFFFILLIRKETIQLPFSSIQDTIAALFHCFIDFAILSTG